MSPCMTPTIRHTLRNPWLCSAVLTSLKEILTAGFEAIALCLEYGIGLCMGGVIGWIAGWSTALIYTRLYEPEPLSCIDAICQWYYLPYEYAGNGLTIGAILGLTAIVCSTPAKRRTADIPNRPEKTEPHMNSVPFVPGERPILIASTLATGITNDSSCLSLLTASCAGFEGDGQ